MVSRTHSGVTITKNATSTVFSSNTLTHNLPVINNFVGANFQANNYFNGNFFPNFNFFIFLC
jgi:hypothetical protein